MRGVIGGKRVDDSGGNAVEAGFHMLITAQRRLHAVVAVVGRDVGIRQHEVMRRYLTRYGEPFLLGKCGHRHRMLGGHVGHVIARPGHLGKQDIAGDHHIL